MDKILLIFILDFLICNFNKCNNPLLYPAIGIATVILLITAKDKSLGKQKI